ncbi:hypothetical protein D1007_48670 [Hordeum vulgare]|nr:hypothetical protein D1007_48670 [Hordeum vulgare]
MKMLEYTTDGGVVDVYVEYFGEKDGDSEMSGSDFEDEIHNEEEGDSEEALNAIISVEEQVDFTAANINGLTSVIASPVRRTIKETFRFQDGQSSHVTHAMTGSSQVLNHGSKSRKTTLFKEIVQQSSVHEREECNSEFEQDSDSRSEDSDYVADSDDSGLEEEYVELKEEATTFKKRIRDSKKWAHKNPTCVVPIDIVANVEEQANTDA